MIKNNNLVVATDNTTQDQFTGYNQIQSNNISSNDDSSLLGMISNTSVVTTKSTQDIAIMSNQQSTSIRHHLKHKLPFTDSVSFKKTLSTSSIIDVAENNNLVVATDNTTQEQSTGYNQIQSNNDISLLGMISATTQDDWMEIISDYGSNINS